MKKTAIAFLATGLLGGLLAAPALGDTACSADAVEVEDLEVKLRSVEASYAVGDKAILKVKVTRRLEPSLPAQPVEGAHVLVMVDVGESTVYGSATTDAAGKGSTKILLEDFLLAGPADGTAYAKKRWARGPICHMEHREEGSVFVDDLFEVTR